MSTPNSVPGHGVHGRTNHPQPYPTDKPEERRCETCNSRITQTRTMGEVGHKYKCPGVFRRLISVGLALLAPME